MNANSWPSSHLQDMPKGCIRTISGRCVDPLSLRAQDVCIEDIAHSLAMQCRWNGHIPSFFSVAEHSLLVSQLCPEEDALWGLLHDASEAYLCDLPRPLKMESDLGGSYRAAEAGAMAVICDRFGLALEMPESVRSADDLMLEREWSFFGLRGNQVWTSSGIRMLSPAKALSEFMMQFDCLMERRRQ